MLIDNLGLDFGVLADTIEVTLAVLMMIGGIALTWGIQKWADRTGTRQPPAANTGLGGSADRHERHTLRD